LSDDGATLTIDYAETVSKAKTTVAKLSIPLAKSLDLEPGALDTWIESLLVQAYGNVPRRRRAFVLVNPHAGTGGAVKKWETQVKPILAAARMELKTVTTSHAGHALDLVQAVDLDHYDIVVACSGDGLAHEIFNGLGRRPDARRALSKLAVCHVPCGSGNAMACNLYGTHKPGGVAIAIVKGVATPMDLASVTYGDKRILSFLSQAAGMVAESDLATEHLRWMGQARFTWGFLERFLAKKTYPCDIAVKWEIVQKEGVKAHYRWARTHENETPSRNGEPANGENGSAEDGLPPLRYGTIQDPLPDGWELVPHDKLGTFYSGNVSVNKLTITESLVADGPC
jgi:sphingosine kinase